MRYFLFLLLLLTFSNSASAESTKITIPGGILKPFYPPSEKETEIVVLPFKIDSLPVTNKNFLQFVIKNPKWQKGKIASLYADTGYLSHWKTPTEVDHSLDNKPVTRISWYAAQDYCKAQGGRLATESEWEFVAQASQTKGDASRDTEFRKKILEWYANPDPSLKNVGESEPNLFGIYDLHGLIWEWVEDFNNSLLVPDSRTKGESDKKLFCGAGAIEASEKEDYATFMRMAYRSSLKASYTTHNLGFRCAYNFVE